LIVFSVTVGRFFQQAQAARLAPGYAGFIRLLGTGDFSRPCVRPRRTEVRLPQVPTEVGVPRGKARGLRLLEAPPPVAAKTIKAATAIAAVGTR